MKLEESLASGPHQQFSQLTGTWSGTTRTWFEPGEPVDVSPMTGSIRPLFDGRFVLHEYEGSFQGKVFQGVAIYGYHLPTQTFQSVWLDAFHMGTGMMFSRSKPGDPFYSVEGSYDTTDEHPQTWGWRTEILVKSPDELVITAFNIAPTGEEMKATETVYQRTA